MLVVFPPIFVADTKIIYCYNFVAPLNRVVLVINKVALFENYRCLK